jgi:hypothetical protein
MPLNIDEYIKTYAIIRVGERFGVHKEYLSVFGYIPIRARLDGFKIGFNLDMAALDMLFPEYPVIESADELVDLLEQRLKTEMQAFIEKSNKEPDYE